MDRQGEELLRQRLEERRRELAARLKRIHENLQRRPDPDSAERAEHLEDRGGVDDAPAKEARLELLQITATLLRMDDGQFGPCTGCGAPIEDSWLEAYPYAAECIDCARRSDVRKSAS
jgi:DnaK suppressor protein